MKILISITVAAACVASLAHAQSAGTMNSMRMNDAAMNQARFNEAMRSSALERQTDQHRDTTNPRRARRAEEAATLINAGNCAGALELAQRGNDDRLAARIREVCATTNVSQPAPATTSTPAG